MGAPERGYWQEGLDVNFVLMPAAIEGEGFKIHFTTKGTKSTKELLEEEFTAEARRTPG